jgi:multiple sugar transport system permease protein
MYSSFPSARFPRPIVGDFFGLGNFNAAVTDKVFGTVMLNTLIWVVSVVGISTLLGFVVAMVMNSRFHGRKLARSIVVFPWATSLVIQASIWNYIIKFEYGNLNNVLLNLGIIKYAVNWRMSTGRVLWECGVGIFVIHSLRGLLQLRRGCLSIDSAYYEAATVDGAGYWKKLTRVTLPLVRPSLTVSTC